MGRRSNPVETRPPACFLPVVRGFLSNVGEEAHQPSITILKEPAVRLQKDTIEFERNAKNFEVSRRRHYPVKVFVYPCVSNNSQCN